MLRQGTEFGSNGRGQGVVSAREFVLADFIVDAEFLSQRRVLRLSDGAGKDFEFGNRALAVRDEPTNQLLWLDINRTGFHAPPFEKVCAATLLGGKGDTAQLYR